jgi:hypothetical protein
MTSELLHEIATLLERNDFSGLFSFTNKSIPLEIMFFILNEYLNRKIAIQKTHLAPLLDFSAEIYDRGNDYARQKLKAIIDSIDSLMNEQRVSKTAANDIGRYESAKDVD